MADLAEETAALLSEDGNLGGRLRQVVEALDYESHLVVVCKDQDEVATRMENLAELGAMATHYADAAAFVDAVDLLSSLDEAGDEDRVWCSTIHAAKGLEWHAVFILGLEDGICPHGRSIEKGDIEEERRLLYVAMTRAKRQLALSWCAERTMWGSRVLSAICRTRSAKSASISSTDGTGNLLISINEA
ncbi:MAG: ATP-dependent helicase [Actinobacteria bacterium]|nr:ATP-dependent helicase [Actinomycetota bacterium]